VSFTITTSDDELAGKLEPGAPRVSQRFQAMSVLAQHGVYTGVSMMPILPFIEDGEENIRSIVRTAHAHGAGYVIAAFGMTLRDRQRAHYYGRLDQLFPGLRRRYERAFGDQYHCAAPNARALERVFREECDRWGMATRMKQYEPDVATQLPLF
jgi:DNA repair photolyase